jgi:glycyl-tRNA synthetase (class II)
MFNLLFKTHVGPVEPSSNGSSGSISSRSQTAEHSKDSSSQAAEHSKVSRSQAAEHSKDSSLSYLRPETAQGVYIHFANVLASTRKRLPFGVGQVGRSFRNEIAVGNFIFRTREFDQMELQYFCAPEDSPGHFDAWVDTCHNWLTRVAGLSPQRVRRRLYAKGVGWVECGCSLCDAIIVSL